MINEYDEREKQKKLYNMTMMSHVTVTQWEMPFRRIAIILKDLYIQSETQLQFGQVV